MTQSTPRNEGSPASTHRQLWSMAGPIILGNVFVPLLGAVDTAVVGQLPQAYYIGAVAIGAMLFNYIYHLFNCLRMGTTGPTAQAVGAGNTAEVRAMIARALLLAGALGATIIALQFPIVAFAFWLIEASPQVEALAREYFLIRVWAMPAVLGAYAIMGWYYGLRQVKVPLALQIVISVLNIGLDFLFVFGFGWAVAGVAAASLIASYAGLAIGLWCVWGTLRKLPDDGRRSRLLDPAQLARMLTINSDIFLRTVCVVSVLGFFMAKSAALGDVPLAANQVLHHLLIFTSFGLDGIAHAAEAILGESVGRHDRDAFRRDMRVVFLWAGVVGFVNMLIYLALGHEIIALMTAIPEVRAMAADYLAWTIVMPLVTVWAYTYDGVYLAATRTRIMRNTMIVSFATFLVVLHALLPLAGNTGLWVAMATFFGGRAVLLHLFLPRVLRGI